MCYKNWLVPGQLSSSFPYRLLFFCLCLWQPLTSSLYLVFGCYWLLAVSCVCASYNKQQRNAKHTHNNKERFSYRLYLLYLVVFCIAFLFVFVFVIVFVLLFPSHGLSLLLYDFCILCSSVTRQEKPNVKRYKTQQTKENIRFIIWNLFFGRLLTNYTKYNNKDRLR